MPRRPRRATGFSLLEILVVVTILALMLGLAGLSLDGSRHRLVQSESKRLMQILVLASEEAVMQGEELGLRVQSDGYVLLRFDLDAESWREMEQRPFRAHRLPEGLTLTLDTEGVRVTQAFDGDGGEAGPPDILLQSDGELSVFELRIADRGPDASSRAVVSAGWLPLELRP